MKKLAKILLVVMLVAAFALVLTACTKTECEKGNHNFTGTETVTKAATCTEKGSKTVKCANCDEVQTQEIAALGHDYAGAWTVVSGKHSQKCSRCDATQQHDADMGAWALVGEKHVQTCTKCTIKGEHAPAFDATIEANVTVTKEASCTEKGSKTITCKDCSLTKTEEIEMKEHDFDETTFICKNEGCNKVGPNAPVKIGTTYFVTLADALAAAQANDTIVLQKDVVIDAMITITKNITLDLNGKTISNTVDIWSQANKAYALITLKNDAQVVITGNGKVLAKANDAFAVNVVKGNLTIANGEFAGNITAIQVQEGEAIIKGGKFSIQQLDTDHADNQYRYLLNCIDEYYTAGTAKIAVYGGEFVNFDFTNCLAEGANTNFAAPGVKAVSTTEGSDAIYTAAFDTKFETTDFDKLEKGEKATVVGIVKNVNPAWPGSLVIADLEDNELTVYGVCDEKGAAINNNNLSNAVAVGDVVVLYGSVTEYHDNLQISYGWLIQIASEAKTTMTAIVLSNIVIPEFVYADLDLYSCDGLVWSVKEGTGIALNGNKATVTRAAQDSVVTLTATLTIGDEIETKDVTTTVVATGTVKVVIDFSIKAENGDGKTTVGYSDINATTASDGEFALNGTTYLFGGCYKTSSYNYIMLAKNNNAYIANKTAMSGAILSIEAITTSGSSGKTHFYIHLSKEATTSTEKNTDNFVGKGTFKKTATAEDGYTYFSVTTAGDSNNGQIARIVITCVESTTAD